MKGIVLAGGNNTRLRPITISISKPLLPVYDKPMVYYPLSTLMLAGIRDIMLIATPRDLPRFQELLNDGHQLGLRLHYETQERPAGIAEAFLIARDFIAGDGCALVLGDNILFGHGLTGILQLAAKRTNGATVFAYQVADPERYGVVEIAPDGRALSLKEKPVKAASRWAVLGLYFYDADVVDIVANLKPSARGELEITDVNLNYLSGQRLQVERLGRGFTWLDAGTFESLQDASEFVRVIQMRQGYRIACLEEIAFNMGFIDAGQLRSLAAPLTTSEYGRYLMDVADSA